MIPNSLPPVRASHGDVDNGERQPLQGDGRRRHLGGDAVVEQHDLQRLAGEAADGEEPDGIGGQADTEEPRERRP